MINVRSTLVYANEDIKQYKSHVTIDGSRTEIASEIKALIHSFLDDSQLEGIYLDISTEIAKARVEELERIMRGIENG